MEIRLDQGNLVYGKRVDVDAVACTQEGWPGSQEGYLRTQGVARGKVECTQERLDVRQTARRRSALYVGVE